MHKNNKKELSKIRPISSKSYCKEELNLLQSIGTSTDLNLWITKAEGFIESRGGYYNYIPCYGHEYDMRGGRDIACGDMNSDGGLNVLDIVALVNSVLADYYDPCGDMNGDGGLNVLDVVTLVNCVLSGDCNDDICCGDIVAGNFPYSPSYQSSSYGNCSPVFNPNCGCCCVDGAGYLTLDSECLGTHYPGEDCDMDCDSGNNYCEGVICENRCECDGYTCFVYFDRQCDNNTGGCVDSVNKKYECHFGCAGGGTKCGLNPCNMGSGGNNRSGHFSVTCPIQMCECDINGNNCIEVWSDCDNIGQNSSNCNCDGVGGYINYFNDECDDSNLSECFCEYNHERVCSVSGPDLCNGDRCATYCESEPNCRDIIGETRCGTLESDSNTYYLFSNPVCDGECIFNTITPCTDIPDMNNGCNENNDNCDNDPCSFYNVSCEVSCIGSHILANITGECIVNSDGDAVCKYDESAMEFCRWGCNGGGDVDECYGGPNIEYSYDAGGISNGSCSDGYVENCSYIPMRHCCPESWISDGYQDCESQLYDCDLTCYDVGGYPCYDSECADGGDCESTGYNICSSPYYAYSGDINTSGIENAPWCTACDEINLLMYGSCCCDSFWYEWGITCDDLNNLYGIRCNGCECPGDIHYENCYNDSWYDPCPELECCPLGKVKDCRCNGECVPDYMTVDGYCHHPNFGSDVDLTCYYNEWINPCGQYSCDGNCGSNFEIGYCFCNESCVNNENCCNDYYVYCG